MEIELLEELKQFLSYARNEGVINDKIADKLEEFVEIYIKNIV